MSASWRVLAANATGRCATVRSESCNFCTLCLSAFRNGYERVDRIPVVLRFSSSKRLLASTIALYSPSVHSVLCDENRLGRQSSHLRKDVGTHCLRAKTWRARFHLVDVGRSQMAQNTLVYHTMDSRSIRTKTGAGKGTTFPRGDAKDRTSKKSRRIQIRQLQAPPNRCSG
jgi:hypothetical protein